MIHVSDSNETKPEENSPINSKSPNEDLFEDASLVLLHQFLAKIASKKYEEALSISHQILHHDPNNELIKEYQSVLAERIEQIKAYGQDEDESESESQEVETYSETDEEEFQQ